MERNLKNYQNSFTSPFSLPIPSPIFYKGLGNSETVYKMNVWGLLIGLIFIAIGIGVFLGVNIWQYIIPLLLILIGLSIIFGRRRHPQSWSSEQGKLTTTHENMLDYSFTFSGGDFKVVTDNFKGGKISALFGGANIDLKSAKIAHQGTVTMEVSAVFGGVKLIVPKTWLVQGTLGGVFGGFSNKTVTPEKPDGTLILKGSGVFGGGEVTN